MLRPVHSAFGALKWEELGSKNRNCEMKITLKNSGLRKIAVQIKSRQILKAIRGRNFAQNPKRQKGMKSMYVTKYTFA